MTLVDIKDISFNSIAIVLFQYRF